MAYKWQFDKYKAPAQETGELFEELERRDGKLTPEAVLDAARSTDSIIHDDFEWDNTVAAEKFRLGQASNMISLLIVVSDEDKPAVRGFVNCNSGIQKGGYVNIGRAMANDDVKAVVLSNARRELEIFQSKYNKYSELADVLEPIAEYLRKTE